MNKDKVLFNKTNRFLRHPNNTANFYKNKQSLKKNFFCNCKLFFKEYANYSNIHGVYYLGEERTRTEKCFWSFVLLLSFIGCIYMIKQIWDKYQINQIVISFETKPSSVYDIPFPAVTICPEAAFAAYKFNYSSIFNKLKHQQEVTAAELKQFNYVEPMCPDAIEIINTQNITYDESFYDVLNEIKPDFTALCNFLGTVLVSCDKIFVPVFTDVGICYSFNMYGKTKLFRKNVNIATNFYEVDEEKTANYATERNFNLEESYPLPILQAGVRSGLKIYIYYNNSNFEDLNCNLFSQGYRVMLHTSIDIPSLSEDFLRVDYDKLVNVAVTPKQIKTTQEVANRHFDKRGCYLPNERKLTYFNFYSVSNCQLECRTNATLKNCGCVLPHMPKKNNTPICSDPDLRCPTETLCNIYFLGV